MVGESYDVKVYSGLGEENSGTRGSICQTLLAELGQGGSYIYNK